jgi:hypothetical protein
VQVAQQSIKNKFYILCIGAMISMKMFKAVILQVLIFLTIGAVFGAVAALIGIGTDETTGYYEQNNELANAMMQLAIVLVGVLIGTFLHLILHELGHLIAGKLSGYTFVSFSIGKLVIVRENGKLVLKKYGVAGMGGQCLMSPPDITNEQYRFPFVFYSLSGGLTNFLFSALFYVISLLTPTYVSTGFMMLASMGVLTGLMNLIPLKIGGGTNDGLNLLYYLKTSENRRAVWLQLKYIALLTQGVRLSDMPKEWFDDMGVPSNSLTGFITLFRCYYFLDKGEIKLTEDNAKAMLENPGKMLAYQLNELRCEVLFAELLRECRANKIKKLYTSKLQAHIKAHKAHLPKLRLMYAYELLYINDETKANKTLQNFEKACLHTPFKGEIAGERELIEFVKRSAEKTH